MKFAAHGWQWRPFMRGSVMIVDDSVSLRSLVKLALTQAGHEVVEASDGLDALAKLEAGGVRLVICDVNMPRMDGISFVKAMKGQAANRFTPVVMLTTEGKSELVAQGKAAGAKAWLVKPFKPEQLLGVVSQLMGP